MNNQPVNQFESPASQQTPPPQAPNISTGKILHLLVGGLVLTLIGSATAHRLQMGTDSYVGSPFQFIEILALPATLVALVIAALSAFVCLFRFQWTGLMVCTIYALVLFAAAGFAMWIDAPFLVYMT